MCKTFDVKPNRLQQISIMSQSAVATNFNQILISGQVHCFYFSWSIVFAFVDAPAWLSAPCPLPGEELLWQQKQIMQT
jgi:hypothetical protein